MVFVLLAPDADKELDTSIQDILLSVIKVTHKTLGVRDFILPLGL